MIRPNSVQSYSENLERSLESEINYFSLILIVSGTMLISTYAYIQNNNDTYTRIPK